MRISDWSSDVCSSDLVFPPCPMENRAAAAHAETSKTWTRLLDQGAHRLTEVGQLKAPVDYAQAGATTPAPSRKTRRQDMPGTETNGGVDRCLLRGTPGYWAGKSRPTSVVSAAFTVTSSPKRSDRKSAVEGKRVSVRVDPGGSRGIKKKKK